MTDVPAIALRGVNKFYGKHHALRDVMLSVGKGEKMVCVTHERGFARKVADRVVFIDAGLIVEQNDPETFFTDPQNDRLGSFSIRCSVVSRN